MALSLGTRAGRRLRRSGRQHLREQRRNLDAALFRTNKKQWRQSEGEASPCNFVREIEFAGRSDNPEQKKKKPHKKNQTMNNRERAVSRSIIKIKLFVIKSYQQPADGTDVAPAQHRNPSRAPAPLHSPLPLLLPPPFRRVRPD